MSDMPYVKKEEYEEQDRLVCWMGEQMFEAQKRCEFWRAMFLAQFCAVIILNYVGWL